MCSVEFEMTCDCETWDLAIHMSHLMTTLNDELVLGCQIVQMGASLFKQVASSTEPGQIYALLVDFKVYASPFEQQ